VDVALFVSDEIEMIVLAFVKFIGSLEVGHATKSLCLGREEISTRDDGAAASDRWLRGAGKIPFIEDGRTRCVEVSQCRV
jgi:hypothetical protein